MNAYYICYFAFFYVDLITIDVTLLNFNRCLLFFSGGGQMSRGYMSGEANVGGMSGGMGQMSGYHTNKYSNCEIMLALHQQSNDGINVIIC